MKKGYNELVGIQARFSRVVQRYSLTHHYRWRKDGETKATGSMRGFDMRRHIPAEDIMRDLRNAYAPAILSIWQQVTKGCVTEYYQLQPNSRPAQVGLTGIWRHWAEL